MAKTRFDLEQEIMDCWGVTDDINVLAENVMEKSPDADTIANVLIGMQSLYQMKFERLFDTFEQCIKNKELKDSLYSPNLSTSDDDISISLSDYDFSTTPGFEHERSYDINKLDISGFEPFDNMGAAQGTYTISDSYLRDGISISTEKS